VSHKKVGDRVAAGEPVATIYYNAEAKAERARQLIEASYVVTDAAPTTKRPLIHRIIGKSGGEKLNGRYTGILGLLTMLGLAFAFSTNRRAIRVKTVAWGLSLQIVFAIFVLRIDYGRRMFQAVGDAATRVLGYAFVGSEFVFGELGKKAPTSVLFSLFRCSQSSFLSAHSSPFCTTSASCSSSSASPLG